MVRKEAIYQDRAEEHYTAAMRAMDYGENSMAVRHFRIASEYGLDRLLVRFRLAILDRYSGRITTALERLEGLIPDSSFNGELFLQLGIVCFDLGKISESHDYFRRALKESPLRWIRIEALRHLKAVVRPEKFSKIMEFAKSGRRLPIDSIASRRTDVWISWLQGDQHKAFLALRDLIREEPDIIQLYLDMAIFSENRRNNGMAITALRFYRSRLPKEYRPALLHARTLYHLKRYSNCASILKRLTGHEGGGSVVQRNLAICLLKNGMIVAAIRSYRRALLLDPEDADAFFGMGVIFHQNGSLDSAEDYYRQAFLLRPHDHRIVYNLGNLLYESGDYHNAIRSFQHALKLKPGFAPAEKNLQFVMMAKICYPEDGPEIEMRKRTGFYWIGVASAFAIILFSFFKGWL